ncbi:MAG: glycosyltransferase family 4 protein [Bacteroidota bacterium]
MYVVISSVFHPEPVVSAIMAGDLAAELAKEVEVKVVTPRPTRPEGFDFTGLMKADELYEHIVVKSFTYPASRFIGRMIESIGFGIHVAKYVKRNHSRISCLYIFAWPLFGQFLIARKAKRYGIPSLVHVQDIYPESLMNKLPILGGMANRLLLPIDKTVLKIADRIVAISDNMSNHLQRTRQIRKDKIETVEIWHNEREFIEYAQVKAGKRAIHRENNLFTFMYLGNIGPVAGVEFLIECFHKANLNKSQLIIAGSGSQKQRCIETAQSLSNPNIRFLDVPNGKVPEIQDGADVMLLPVKKGAAMSSIPSKLAAYMFSSKPVIACVDHSSDTALAITCSKCGWVLPAEEQDPLIRQMMELETSSTEDLPALGKNGYNYAKAHFSREVNVQKLVSIMKAISRF